MIKIVKNERKYWNFIKNLRTDQRTIHGFIENTNITEEEQDIYMSKYNDCYYIALYNDKPAGFIGVINNDIRVATHPDFQKLGIAVTMINLICEKYPSAFAKVKVENKASLELFKKCGFEVSFYLMHKKHDTNTI